MLCRLCVSESTELLDMCKLYYGETPAITYIVEVLDIKVDSEGSDTSTTLVMCSDCNTALSNFHSFCRMVREAQHRYKHMETSIEISKNNKNENFVKLECDNDSHHDDIDYTDSKVINDDILSKKSVNINPKKKKRKSLKDSRETECKYKLSLDNKEIAETKGQRVTEIITKKYRFSEVFSDGKFTLNTEQKKEMFSLYFDMKCEFCPDVPSFLSYEELSNHCTDLHHTMSRVKCCNYYAKSHVMMESHILRRHIAPNQMTPPSLKTACKVCGKMITTTGLKKHLINHLPPEKRNFRCEQCTAGFAKACLLKNHIERCHRAEAVKCETCHKMVRSRACLAAHVRRVHGPANNYLCAECGKSYKNYDNYTAHVRKHSGLEDKVKCPKCDAVIKRCSLRCHLRRHDPDMKKQCPHCPHRAIHGLSEHIKRVHEKLKRFSCSVCPMKFYSELSLKDHTSSRHTGIPEYWCEFCGKTFMNSGNYHVHRKKMHAAQLAEKRLQSAKSKAKEDVPVYDPEAPKKRTALQGIEADRILQDLHKEKTRRGTESNGSNS